MLALNLIVYAAEELHIFCDWEWNRFSLSQSEAEMSAFYRELCLLPFFVLYCTCILALFAFGRWHGGIVSWQEGAGFDSLGLVVFPECVCAL